MNMMMTLPSLRQMRGSLVRLKSWKLSEDQRNEKVPQSNFEAEMKRRNEINDKFHILRTLIPNNTGMDRASVIGDTIAYVSKLQREVQELHEELKRNSNDGAKETSYICGNDGNLQSELPRQIETISANTPVNEKMEAAMMIMPNLIHRLRSLVGLKGWDCCALWKLSEDQRFIELIDCCCAGTEITQSEAGQNLPFPPVLACRDTILQHPRTTSCDLLAQIPSSMPLDSGIYAETLISNQTSWLNFSNNTFLSILEETIGTRVVIPIPGGIIELLVTKQVFEDQHVIDFVTAQYNISLEEEALTNITAENGFQEMEAMQRSIISERQQHMDMQQYMEALVPNMDQQEGNEKRDSNTHEAEGQAGDFMSDCSDQIDEEEDTKYQRRTGKRPQAKNLIAERKMRKKLNDRLYVLRSLVPIISKLDRASIVGDAIEYVKQLQKQAKQLQDELDDHAEGLRARANKESVKTMQRDS